MSVPHQPVTAEEGAAILRLHHVEGWPVGTIIRGKVIMREGDAGMCMYVVVKGRVAIAIRDKIVEMVGAGGTFGEMALVDQSARTASAGATVDCELLSVNRKALLDLIKAQPAFGVTMLRAVADRLRHMNALLAS